MTSTIKRDSDALRVAVIGGGAAGMMAAIFASVNGAAVTLFERNDRLGKKLRITGKGRCNLTNNCELNEFLNNVPTNARFLYAALSRFSTADTMDFFEDLGVPLKTERGKRVFPQSDKAGDVVAALDKRCRALGVDVVNRRVDGLLLDGDTVKGVRIGSEELEFDRVIVATGGRSYPMTGSTGDGYRFAKEVGHTVTP